MIQSWWHVSTILGVSRQENAESREEKICIVDRNKQKIIDVLNGFYHLDVLHRLHIE